MGILDRVFGRKKEQENQAKQFDEAWKAIEEQIRQKEQETEAALVAEDLTPETMNGKKRYFHYKDVHIQVSWRYGGHYGKTLSDLGMVRGSSLSLILAPQDDDPQCVKVCYNDIEIGVLGISRFQSMVYQWKERSLPVLAVANSVGGEYKLLIELSFYGYVPKKKKKSEE